MASFFLFLTISLYGSIEFDADSFAQTFTAVEKVDESL